jgi:hypothetical protein
MLRRRRAASRKSESLVPTLRVGTHAWPLRGKYATQSVAWRVPTPSVGTRDRENLYKENAAMQAKAAAR